MKDRTKNSLLGRGFPSDLIEKIGQHNHTINNLKSFSKEQLESFYTQEEAEFIQEKIQRQPIDEVIVEQLLQLSNGVCCYCADGNAVRPYQIHHIEEHAVSQDDSLQNLMLICPTHHALVPKRGYSVEEQKQKRMEWYALAAMERDYQSRSLSFPHGSFESLVYLSAPSTAELFSFGVLSPSTAQSVSNHQICATAKERLQRENFLLIVGNSGAGKTTLAIGMAHSIPNSGDRVYRYVRSFQNDNRKSLGEILTFIIAASQPCTLIVDDINLWATNDDIEKIARSSSPIVMVIATATRTILSEQGKGVDVPFPFNRLVIGWENLKPFVFDYLKQHEPEVIAILRPYRETGPLEQLGFGPMENDLSNLIGRYQDKVNSVWQFFFLLCAGWRLVEEDLNELILEGRSDIPVLYAAIEQIADVERAVTVEEVEQALSGTGMMKTFPNITTEWIKTVYEGHVKRRVMVRVRDAYKTVHRDWAWAFIRAALGNACCKQQAIELLERVLNLQNPKPLQWAALRSWLKMKEDGKRFLDEWFIKQSRENWVSLVGAAARNGLADTALVAGELHLMSYTAEWNDIVGDAFENHEETIRQFFQGASPEDWYYLERLFMAISHARPAFAARIVESWGPQVVAEIINCTHPDYYASVRWFLGGSVCKHSPEWCRAVGRYISWESISDNLRKVRSGDTGTVEELVSLLGRLDVPIRRSMVRRIAEVLYDVLQGAQLSEIKYGGLIEVIELFPNEMQQAASALNAKKLAEEASQTPPHQWRDLLMLSLFACRAGSNFAEEFVEHLNDEKLINVVDRYAAAHPRIFLPLIHQLSLGRDRRRHELAEKLRPSALIACQHAVNEEERDRILLDFAKLDDKIAADLARELKIIFPVPEASDTNGIAALKKPIGESSMSEESKERLKTLEESGEDYDVRIMFEGS